MKRALRWLVVVSVLGALVLLALRLVARRGGGEERPIERWEPPVPMPPTVSVEPPATSEAPAVEAAEEAPSIIEGEFEPPEEGGPPEDEPFVEEPAEELSEPLLDAAREEAEPELTRHTAEAERAAHDAEAAADVAAGRELADALLARQEPESTAEPMPSEPGMETESGIVTPDEALARDRDDGMPAPAALVAEEMGPAASRATPSEPGGTGAAESPDLVLEPRNAEAEAASDVLVRHFEELAATPLAEEPAAPAAMPAAEQAPSLPTEGDNDLADLLDEALEDVAPAPIIPPPRRGADAFLDEGNVYFNVGQYALAIDRYTRAVELDPQLIAGFYNRANARTRAGEFDEALADYDRALELQPHDADALNNRGMLHLYRGNYAMALHDFDAAIIQDPGDTTVMVNRGLAHLHGGNAGQALIDFREASAHDPSDAAAHYGAAQASATIGNRSEALQYIEGALKLDPAYAREAAGDPRLAFLQGDETFLRLLREAGARQ